MNHLIVIAACIAAVVCTGGYPAEYATGRYAYHGRYGGKCGNDGFYYRDHGSFIICSNGNAYEQPCAPGSRNSAYDKYNRGGHYYYRDFCDVNLVDYGAGIPHGYGYGGHGAGYGHGQGYGYGGEYGHRAGYGAGYGAGHGDGYGYGRAAY